MMNCLLLWIRNPLWGLFLCLFGLQLAGVAGECGSRAWAGAVVKIGVLEEPRTLNIWLASDAWSTKVLNRVYHSLYIRHPETLKLIPWLAESPPAFDEAKLAYTIRLRDATWSDGSPLTAEDVAFTGNVIKEFKVPRFYSNWRFIKHIEILDRHTVRIVLEEPKAIFLSRTLTTPIVQKKEWEPVVKEARRAENPLGRLLNREVLYPVGTGPFTIEQRKQGAFLFLRKNEHFFGKGKEIAGYRLGPHIDGIILKIFGTPDAAVMAIRKGAIDMFWWGIQPGYLEELQTDRNIRIFSSEKSGLYYLGFNLREKPFDDLAFRRAVAFLVDREFIIKRILQGYAEHMDSIVPPGNAFWHAPDMPSYGSGLTRDQRIREAAAILESAGYAWEEPPVDEKGEVGKCSRLITPDGRPMKKLTIFTPPADYDPLRAMTGIMIQEWLKMVGIPASARAMAFSSLTHYVKARRQFDMFVLGYGNLSLDPDYLRNFFHSANDKPRGWNTSGYHNPEFDRLADASSRAMDMDRRRELIFEMQRIIMGEVPFFPLYNPKLIEAVREDTFTGWVQMLGGIGNTWSLCRLKPK
ncbi:MAG: ABC transporter substrate-binding protein [Deltaproteobacteria bacterium]|nr:ABC transporter substrate-binding protein [Deltaproteobacteria bacterium]MBW1815997.1 ABC transporter substrate-binding protein [Deltaproteobacteria bacterium]